MTFIAAGFPITHRPNGAALIAGLSLLAALCVALPLATWAVAIAVFGLPHVLFEMRYVAHRFGVRLRALALLIGAPLGIALAARAAGSGRLISPELAGVIELVCGALLALIAVSAMRRRRGVGVCVAAAIVAGAYVSAPLTLLVLSLLHNFTPVALLADAAPEGRKAAAAARAAAFFLLPPLIVMTGAPFGLLDAIGWTAPTWSPLPASQLDGAISTYVPASFLQSDWALHAFSAAVMAQCLHYYATIRILPSLSPAPTSGGGIVAIVVASGLMTALFLSDYTSAKSLYSLAALAHSWIEIPVLLLALDASYGERSKPAANDAPLADNDNASARAGETGSASAKMIASTAIAPASATITADA
jgi:hypothetical protein